MQLPPKNPRHFVSFKKINLFSPHLKIFWFNNMIFEQVPNPKSQALNAQVGTPGHGARESRSLGTPLNTPSGLKGGKETHLKLKNGGLECHSFHSHRV